MMSQYHDPTWLVERAWSSFRLITLQKMIEGTIGELQQLQPAAAGEPCPASIDARKEALRACIEELRDASGMRDAESSRAAHRELVQRCLAKYPAAWGESFSSALDEYRRAASNALQASFEASDPAPRR